MKARSGQVECFEAADEELKKNLLVTAYEGRSALQGLELGANVIWQWYVGNGKFQLSRYVSTQTCGLSSPPIWQRDRPVHFFRHIP